MKNISWNEYFMKMAELTAERSKDPKTKVGAVIVNPINHHVISIGYNGMPTGFEDEAKYWDDRIKHNYVVHAEANAILNSNTSLEGAHIYISMFPCNECAKLIAQAGIKKVFYHDDKYLSKDSGKVALEIFNNLNISIERIEYEQ